MLESHLTEQTFLVGERITMADIAVFCALEASCKAEGKGDASFPMAISRWMNTCENQPQFK